VNPDLVGPHAAGRTGSGSPIECVGSARDRQVHAYRNRGILRRIARRKGMQNGVVALFYGLPLDDMLDRTEVT